MKAFPTREEIERAQLEKLRQLLAVIVPANRFYAEKLAAAGAVIPPNSLDEFSRTFPFTTKQEISENQKAFPLYGTNLTFPIERYTRFHQTSGTTGVPLRWLDTPESWQWMVDSWKEVFRAADVGVGKRVYFAFSFGPFIGFWLAYESAQQLGCLCFPGGGLSSEARLKAILEQQIEVLCCTPTYALHLAEVARREHFDLSQSKVKTLIVAGEPGGSLPSFRSQLQQLWPGTRVVDHHGMTEVGPVTYECPTRPCILHVVESAYLAEIIDPASGKPVGSSRTGELVLTTLGRTGSPLLRYRTGDLVKPGKMGVCSCGRHELALEGGILGRADDMVIVRGVNIFPSAIDEIVRGIPEIAEYQVKLGNPGPLLELSVVVEPQDGANQRDLVRRLEKTFQMAFNLRIPVTLAPVGTLPRFEMKAKRWIRG